MQPRFQPRRSQAELDIFLRAFTIASMDEGRSGEARLIFRFLAMILAALMLGHAVELAFHPGWGRPSACWGFFFIGCVMASIAFADKIGFPWRR